MAQVSVQYALDHQLDLYDEKRIKQELIRFHGLYRISLNKENSILCIDFDDHMVNKTELEQCLANMNYTFLMIDAITFLD